MFYQIELREDKMEERVRCLPGFRSNWVVGENKPIQGGKHCLLGRSGRWASLSSPLGSVKANPSSNLPTNQLCFSNQPRPLHAVPLSLLTGKVSIYFLSPVGHHGRVRAILLWLSLKSTWSVFQIQKQLLHSPPDP